MQETILSLLNSHSVISFLGAFGAGSLTAVAPCSIIAIPLLVGSSIALKKDLEGKMLYLAKQKYPSYNIYFVNISTNRDIAIKLKVMMIPTQIVYDGNGTEIFRHVGKLEQDELEKVFKEAGFVRKK